MCITLFFVSLCSTTVMTTFSYLISYLFKEPFKEPLLLALIVKDFDGEKKIINYLSGWILHYLIGILLNLLFLICVVFYHINLSWSTGLIYGVIIGVSAIFAWKLMFKTSELRIQMNYKIYYVQLFVAHLFFSFTTLLLLRIFL